MKLFCPSDFSSKFKTIMDLEISLIIINRRSYAFNMGIVWFIYRVSVCTWTAMSPTTKFWTSWFFITAYFIPKIRNLRISDNTKPPASIIVHQTMRSATTRFLMIISKESQWNILMYDSDTITRFVTLYFFRKPFLC